ncbi:hypothetical protein ACMFMG_003189 [Clarireedia jacksonii]
MNPLSARIQVPQLDPHQTPSVSRRRSARIQSRIRSVSIPHIVGSYYESQSPLEQQPADPQTSQPVGASLYTCVPASSPTKVSATAPSRAPFQEYLYPLQTRNAQTRKRKSDRSIETAAARPPKRARLTKKNLKELERVAGRVRESTEQSLAMNKRKSKPSDSETRSTRSKQTTSTTESGFQDIAFQNRVLNPNCSKSPANLVSHQDRIDRS